MLFPYQKDLREGFGRWKVPARPEVFGENGEAGKDL
jgi:hypothetical protein